VNGVHDLGGMHGLGRIAHDRDEHMFHARWEGRMHGIWKALGELRRWRAPGRPAIEGIPAARYLAMSYYQRVYTAMVKLLIDTGLITEPELASGRPTPTSRRGTPPLTPERAATLLYQVPERRIRGRRARFRVGQQVRARNLHPEGHTRLPRYVRGHTGKVVRVHALWPLPDSDAYMKGERLQHVYCVRFTARELWGPQAHRRDSVHVELWEDYLEPAR
jgi:nitrile hydratase